MTYFLALAIVVGEHLIDVCEFFTYVYLRQIGTVRHVTLRWFDSSRLL